MRRRDPGLEGLALFERGRFAPAHARFAAALAKDPDRYSWTLLAKAACALELGRPLEAALAVERHELAHGRSSAADALRRQSRAQAAGSGLMPPLLPPGLHLDGPLPQRLRGHASRVSRLILELDLATVQEGLREIAFVNLDDADPERARIPRLGLKLRELVRVKRYTGYAHHHMRAEAGDPDGVTHAVVARERGPLDEVEALFKRGLDGAGHARVGELLGFPSCCTSFFARVSLGLGAWDPMLEIALNTPGSAGARSRGRREAVVRGHPYCNVLLRYGGLRLGSWLPCSFRCKRSIAAAGRWAAVARRVDPGAAETLLWALALPASWTCVAGYARVEAPPLVICGESAAAADVRVVRFSASA